MFEKKKPVLLNYAQCSLNIQEFYPAIEYCTEILKQDPDNVKALFRRAKAHTGAWNLQEARSDFTKALQLDPMLSAAVAKELKHLDEMDKLRDKEDKEKFKKLFS